MLMPIIHSKRSMDLWIQFEWHDNINLVGPIQYFVQIDPDLIDKCDTIHNYLNSQNLIVLELFFATMDYVTIFVL